MNPENDFSEQAPRISGDQDKGSLPKQEDTERSQILDKIHQFFKDGSSRKIASLMPYGFSDPTVDDAVPHTISVYRDLQGKYTIDDPNRMAFSDPDLLKALDNLLSGYPKCYKDGHLIVADLEVGQDLKAQEASWNVEAQKLSDFVQSDIIPSELVALRDAQNPEKIQGRVYKLDQERCMVMVGDEDPVRYLMPIQKIGLCFEETQDKMIAEMDTDNSEIRIQLRQDLRFFTSPHYAIDRALFPKGVAFFTDPGRGRKELDRYLEFKKGERSEHLNTTKLMMGLMASYFDIEDGALKQIFEPSPEKTQVTLELQRQIAQECPLFVEYERFYERMVEYLKDKDDKQKGYWDMQHHVVFGCLMTDFEMNPAGEDSKERAIFRKTQDSLTASMTEEQLQRAETKVRKFMD